MFIPRVNQLSRVAYDAAKKVLPARSIHKEKQVEGEGVTGHASQHGTGGDDLLTPAGIGASAQGHDHPPQHNLSATAAPTVNDDETQGYEPGSEWVDQTNDKAYTCVDATTGAAVWIETTQAAGGGAPHNILGATHPDTLAGTVVAGDVMVGNATPKWSRLGVGDDGLVLTAQADGSVAWEAAAGGGGNTLDAAYDQGGAGAGRIVTVDSGAVELRHTSNVAMLATRDPGDSADRFALSRDGDMSWGSGAAAADIVLSRAAANRLAFAAGDILSVQYVADVAGTTRITTSAASPHVHIDETMRVDQALGIMSNPSTTWAEFLTVSPTLPAVLTPAGVSVLKINPSLTTTQGFGIYYALEGILSVVSQGSGQTIYEYGLSYVVVATNNTLNVNTWAELMGLNMGLTMNAGASATLNVTLAASGKFTTPTFLGTPANINVATMHGLMVLNHGHARVANSYGIRIYDQTGSSVAAYGIYVEDADTYALWMDAGLSRFDGDGTHVFELPVNAVDPTGGGGAATGRIPCTIGGATRHLAYY